MQINIFDEITVDGFCGGGGWSTGFELGIGRPVDIGLRMLTPRELYNAQGFPPDYEIEVDCYGNAYPKKEQVARCGNSVPPPFATALVRANWPEACGKEINTMAALNDAWAV